jgi:uncharacterized protein YdaT
MTAPTNNGHGHEHEAPPFLPDAHFAVQAQQEEIDGLRQEVKQARDRAIYQRAIVLQLQAEANHQIGLLQGQLEQERAEKAKLAAELAELRGDAGEKADGAETDAHLDGMLSLDVPATP